MWLTPLHALPYKVTPTADSGTRDQFTGPDGHDASPVSPRVRSGPGTCPFLIQNPPSLCFMLLIEVPASTSLRPVPP